MGLKHFSLRDTESGSHVGTLVVDDRKNTHVLNQLKGKIIDACESHFDEKISLISMSRDLTEGHGEVNCDVVVAVGDDHLTYNMELSKSWIF